LLPCPLLRSLFHSTAIFPCPNQELALPQNDGTNSVHPSSDVFSVAILNDKLDQVVAVDAAKHQMTVGAGMDMNKLFKHATENSMSVQLMTLPFYAGLTLGGILSTASHGTGDRLPSAFGDTVVEVTYVDAQGNVHKVRRRHTTRAAASGQARCTAG
jgi:FAD/FMN-containing dehydrogenase